MPHESVASNSDKNAGYDPYNEYIRFGVPSADVDAGEDQSVIIHEYGHALHDALMPGELIGWDVTRSISEGLSDYFGVSYRRDTDTFSPNKISNWFWPDLRELSSSATYSTHWDGIYDPYVKGILWASTLMDMEFDDCRYVSTYLSPFVKKINV